MDWILTDEQRMIAESARGFAKRHADLDRVRALRDQRDPLAYTPELWQHMASLGWLLVSLPEAQGGLGLGVRGATLILEHIGATLAPEPLLPQLAAVELLSAGEHDAHLPGLTDGSTLTAIAWQEPGQRYTRRPEHTRLTPHPEGMRLSGEKLHVEAGAAAQLLLTSAVDEDGQPCVVAVPADTPGVDITRQHRIDHRNVARVRFRDVPVRAEAVFGDQALIERALDVATIHLCAEMLGAMAEAFQRTLAYLRERRQFGRPIGSFQALQHRAARLFSEIELCRAALEYAANVADTPDLPGEALAQAASLVKARVSEVATAVGYEAIQMHGGIGMTDEHDIGFFLKRARVAEMTLGDAAWHRDRWARLGGF